MRICLVSNEFAPFHGSGVGVYAAEAVRAWTAAGHEVHVITGDHPGVAERGPILCPGVVFHPVDLQDGMAANLPEPRGAVQWPLGAFERLARLHARGQFDYIEFPDLHGEGFFAMQSRRLEAGLPGAVLGVRLHMPCCLIDAKNGRTWRGRLRAYLEEMERAAIEGADIVWAPCAAIADEMRRIGVRLGQGGQRVVVSPNPLALVQSSALIVPNDLGAGPEEALRRRSGTGREGSATDGPAESIVFVGRLERRKGVETLVNAGIELARQRPALQVRLIGGDTDTGPLDAGVADWLDALIPPDVRDRVRLEGHLPRERAIEAMDRATVVCFPALWDNWPYAVLEAMSAGRCIVATRAGGQAEMLDHDATALLCEPGDAPALADALRAALDDPDLRARLGAAASKRARDWCDPARFARQTIHEIQNVRGSLPTTGATPAHARGSDTPDTPDAPNAPDVTVIIPHKDMGDLLTETLESLSAQTARAFSIILADDDSTSPRTLALLDTLERDALPARPDITLRVIRLPRSTGPASARNAAIAAATTPFVVPLDADDLLAPTHLQRCRGVLHRHPSLACVSSLVLSFDEHPCRPTGSWAPLGLVRDMLPAMNTLGTGSGIMFRRDVLLSLRPNAAPGPYDPAMPGYEDWEMYCALADAGHRAEILPDFLVHYRVRPDSRYHGHDRLRHDRLVGEIAARHPRLAEHPDVAARLLLAEARARQQPDRARLRRLRKDRDALRARLNKALERLAEMRQRLDALKSKRRIARGSRPAAGQVRAVAPKPLRYAAADRAAALLRRAGLAGAARTLARRFRR